MVQCGACGKFLRDGAVCPSCKSTSHYECVRLPLGVKIADSWRCGACQAGAPKGRDPSTPVRTERQGYAVLEEPMALDETANNTTKEFSDTEFQLRMRSFREHIMADFAHMHSTLSADLNALKTDFNSMFTELREFRLEMTGLRESISVMGRRMDDLEGRLVAVERRPVESSSEVETLKRCVGELKEELNERDQDALLADLEIGQLPEERGENVMHAVIVLAAKLGVKLEERDIVFAERVGAPLRGEGPEGGAPRVRRIVVRFTRRDIRDRLLQGARIRRTLHAADAGQAAAAAGTRIFLNERLSRVNRQLYYRVREECRRAQWRFAWTKRGRVFARQAEGKPAFPLRSEADVLRVFGSASV